MDFTYYNYPIKTDYLSVGKVYTINTFVDLFFDDSYSFLSVTGEVLVLGYDNGSIQEYHAASFVIQDYHTLVLNVDLDMADYSSSIMNHVIYFNVLSFSVQYYDYDLEDIYFFDSFHDGNDFPLNKLEVTSFDYIRELKHVENVSFISNYAQLYSNYIGVGVSAIVGIVGIFLVLKLLFKRG